LRAVRDYAMSPLGQNPDRYVINERLGLLAGPKSYGSWRQRRDSCNSYKDMFI